MPRTVIWIFVDWRTRVLYTILLTVVVLLLCPWLRQSMMDGYAAYSGVVIDKGIEHHLLSVRGNEKYIVLRDENGRTAKRYVGHYGYAFTHVGTFVIKKRGFGEYPKQLGERTPGELMRDLEQDKELLKPKSQ